MQTETFFRTPGSEDLLESNLNKQISKHALMMNHNQVVTAGYGLARAKSGSEKTWNELSE